MTRRRWSRSRNPVRKFWFWLLKNLFGQPVRRCICGRDFVAHTSRKRYCSQLCGAHGRAEEKKRARWAAAEMAPAMMEWHEEAKNSTVNQPASDFDGSGLA